MTRQICFSAKLRPICLFLIIALSSLPAAAEIETPVVIDFGARHMVVIQADLTNIWGSYYFAIKNTDSEPRRFRAPVMLPSQTIDFKAQEGLLPGDLQVTTLGELFIEKEFPPGLNLIAVSFKVDHNGGRASRLDFTALVTMAEFSVMTPDGAKLRLESNQLGPGIPSMLAGSRFIGLVNEEPMQVGDTVTVDILDIPGGREAFWILGVAIFLLVATIASICTLRTKTSSSID